MWWRKKKKSLTYDERKEPSRLSCSSKDIEAMLSKAALVFSTLKNFVWNIPIASESGRKALEDLTSKLQLEFPVELSLVSDGEWKEDYPMLMTSRRDEQGGFVLSMRHRADYNAKDTLIRAIHFLIGAKMIETAFPGMMAEGDKTARDTFAEIAYQIKEPCFPGGETADFGRVYPYPVFRGSHDPSAVEYAIYKAIVNFYQQELLARTYPTPVLGGELYEFNLLTTLLPGQKSLESMMNEIAIVVAESKLNYGRRWAQLPTFVSDEFERLVQVRGSGLFLETIKERYGSSTVQTAYSIVSQLPLENGKGFGPPILHDIYKVLNELHVFVDRGQVLKVEEIDRLKLNVALKGEWGGMRGRITIEKKPPIAFT
jgi:hypothetical protein